VRKLLLTALWFQGFNTVVWGVMCGVSIYSKGIQNSVPFLVFVSVYALFSTSLVGSIMAIASLKEIKELKKSNS
jgi:hypothetical protein